MSEHSERIIKHGAVVARRDAERSEVAPVSERSERTIRLSAGEAHRDAERSEVAR
ncbi:hypothetical protein KBX50_15915 [Micromonospora sp. C51]|uniref:hypothetical protein n=1 Tax=Micromonospora sp. C51 TaxID=2824879 RepID=UPI001B369E23|nr:hypothetical protein [Micromonospora sp. C51]MBQ1049945.1 hypothetical protein [Micromonospora sp. C51]